MIKGFATPPHLAHAHMQRKETYFAPPIPKQCANGSCHQGLWFLHTSRVYDLALIIHLSRHGALLRFSPHQKGGVIDNQMRPCHHSSNSKTSVHATGKYTQVCAKVSQCSPILHSYLSSFEHSLILQDAYKLCQIFLVCSSFSLVLGIFDQMRLRVKFDS